MEDPASHAFVGLDYPFYMMNRDDNVRGAPKDYRENTCSTGSACQLESSVSRRGRKRCMTC